MKKEVTTNITVCDDCGKEDHFSMVECAVCQKDYCGICKVKNTYLEFKSLIDLPVPSIGQEVKGVVVGKCCDALRQKLSISTSIEPNPDPTVV